MDAIAAACALPGLDAEGIFTHFAVSDMDGADYEAYTREQFGVFTRVLDALAAKGRTFRIRHCANSGALTRYPEMYLDMVRPGIALYGVGDDAERLGLRPVMRLKSSVSTIKVFDPDTTVSYGRTFRTEGKTRIGVLPIGYADGFFRGLSNRHGGADGLWPGTAAGPHLHGYVHGGPDGPAGREGGGHGGDLRPDARAWMPGRDSEHDPLRADLRGEQAGPADCIWKTARRSSEACGCCKQVSSPPQMRRTSVLRSKTLKWAEFISDHLSPMKGLPPGSRSRWDTDLCGEQTGPQIVYGKRQGDRAKPAAAVSRSVRRRKCGFWRGDSPRGNTPSAQTNQQILRIR